MNLKKIKNKDINHENLKIKPPNKNKKIQLINKNFHHKKK